MEPQGRLLDVSAEELRYETADVRDLRQALQHFFWNFLIEAHRSRRNAREFRNSPFVQIEKIGDLTRA